MAGFFDIIKSGWHVVYAVEIEGIPVLWSESATGHAAAGYTEALDADGQGVLVIDQSGEIGQTIDRATGIGAGQPLTFSLRHCASIETYIRRAALTANLTVGLTAAGVTATVDDTTGWAAAGDLWIGSEAITYTGIAGGPPRFTGLTRGRYGSLASSHESGNTARVVTDRPAWWKGRQVRLWMYATDPSGYVCSDRREAWRGHISTGPDRDGTSWQFEALSLDRRLADDVLQPIEATVSVTAIRHAVYKSDIVGISGSGGSAFEFGLYFHPFENETDGSLLTVEEQGVRISAGFSSTLGTTINQITGLADLAAKIGPLEFSHHTPVGSIAWLSLVSPSVGRIGARLNEKESDLAYANMVHSFGYKFVIWQAAGQLVASGFAQPFGTKVTVAPQITLDLGGNTDATITASGWLIDSEGTSVWYTSREISGALATFYGILDGKGGEPTAIPVSWVPGAKLTITTSPTAATFGTFARTLLESSGDANRGTFDTGGGNEGYGFDGDTAGKSAINVDSFDLFAAPGNALKCVAPSAESASFSSICGGMLAAQQNAVVARPDSSDSVRLNLVSVSTVGSAYTFTLTDADLLATAGDPVVAVRRRTVPNVCIFEATAVKDGPQTATYIDAQLVRAQGRSDVTFSLPVQEIGADLAQSWARSIVESEQLAQAIDVRCGPWVDAQIGDLGWLVLTHYGVWSMATGTVGYTGPGRVLGARTHPVSLVRTLTILIDAAPSSSLCPSAPVTGYDASPGPGEVYVPAKYYNHLRKTLDDDGPFSLVHYQPGCGNEAGGGSLTFNDVALSGSDTVLTVSADNLTVDLDNTLSYLTLPATGDCTAYQTQFAHDEDGTLWL